MNAYSKIGFLDEFNEVPRKERDLYTDICDVCLNFDEVFDLNTFTFNEDIINSVKTDIEILTASVDLLKLLLSGNQAIIANYNQTYDL